MTGKAGRNTLHKQLDKEGVITWLLDIFVAYCHVEQLSEQAREYFSHTQGRIVDFFLYYKQQLLLFVAGIIVVYAFMKFLTGQWKIRKLYICRKQSSYIRVFLLGTFFLVILSTVRVYLCGNTGNVWFGIHTEREGVWTLLAYLVLFFASYEAFRTQRQKEIFKKCLIVLSVLLIVLTAVECFVKPIYEFDFMKYLIAPERYREMAESLRNESYQGQAVLGLYNPGYLGGLCVLLFPFHIGLVCEAPNKKKKYLHALLCAGMFLSILASASTAALYAGILACVYLLLVFRKNFMHLLKRLLMVAGCILLLLVIGLCVTRGRMTERLWKTIVHDETLEYSEEHFEISAIQLKDGILQVASDKKCFFIELTNGADTTVDELYICDEEKEELAGTIKDGQLVLTAEGYEGVTLTCYDAILELDCGYEESIGFYMTGQGLYMIGQNGSWLDEIPQPAVVGLEKYYDFATGRGYMWIQSIPVLRECIVLGKGAGSFVYEFRQNEVAGLINIHGSSRFVIDKPHNWYIQTAVQSGIPAALLLVGLLLGLFVKCIMVYGKDAELQKEHVLVLALSAGVFAFAVTGMVNDSIVAVNPIFWIVCGFCCGEVNKWVTPK